MIWLCIIISLHVESGNDKLSLNHRTYRQYHMSMRLPVKIDKQNRLTFLNTPQSRLSLEHLLDVLSRVAAIALMSDKGPLARQTCKDAHDLGLSRGIPSYSGQDQKSESVAVITICGRHLQHGPRSTGKQHQGLGRHRTGLSEGGDQLDCLAAWGMLGTYRCSSPGK